MSMWTGGSPWNPPASGIGPPKKTAQQRFATRDRSIIGSKVVAVAVIGAWGFFAARGTDRVVLAFAILWVIAVLLGQPFSRLFLRQQRALVAPSALLVIPGLARQLPPAKGLDRWGRNTASQPTSLDFEITSDELRLLPSRMAVKPFRFDRFVVPAAAVKASEMVPHRFGRTGLALTFTDGSWLDLDIVGLKDSDRQTLERFLRWSAPRWMIPEDPWASVASGPGSSTIASPAAPWRTTPVPPPPPPAPLQDRAVRSLRLSLAIALVVTVTLAGLLVLLAGQPEVAPPSTTGAHPYQPVLAHAPRRIAGVPIDETRQWSTVPSASGESPIIVDYGHPGEHWVFELSAIPYQVPNGGAPDLWWVRKNHVWWKHWTSRAVQYFCWGDPRHPSITYCAWMDARSSGSLSMFKAEVDPQGIIETVHDEVVSAPGTG